MERCTRTRTRTRKLFIWQVQVQSYNKSGNKHNIIELYKYSQETEAEVQECRYRQSHLVGHAVSWVSRTEYADKRLRIYLPTFVNDTPTDILAMITTHCLQDFTKNVKHYLIEQYAIVCSIPDCYICQRT